MKESIFKQRVQAILDKYKIPYRIYRTQYKGSFIKGGYMNTCDSVFLTPNDGGYPPFALTEYNYDNDEELRKDIFSYTGTKMPSLQEIEIGLVPKDFRRLYTIIKKKNSPYKNCVATFVFGNSQGPTITEAKIFTNGINYHLCLTTNQEEIFMGNIYYNIFQFTGCGLDELVRWLQTIEGHNEIIYNRKIYQGRER